MRKVPWFSLESPGPTRAFFIISLIVALSRWVFLEKFPCFSLESPDHSGSFSPQTVRRGPQSAARSAMEGTASEADCRICGETCATSELVVPCGCKGTAAYAHRKCIQRWISTPKPKCAGRASDRCEVCGEAWRGDYDIPVIQTEEQTSFEDSTENVEALLYAAHARTLAGAELPLDHVFLATVGSRVDGPWSRRASAYGRVKRGLRKMLGTFVGASRRRRSATS